MSRETERLEEQLHHAFHGEAWHGPPVLETLKDVTPAMAAAHPVAGAHSIWELALHLAATYRLVLRRLGGEAAQLTPEEDWATVPEATVANWNATVSALTSLNEEMRRSVGRFAPERLDEALVAVVPYTAYTQFIGITQHDLYHAGQIALLKRALTTSLP